MVVIMLIVAGAFSAACAYSWVTLGPGDGTTYLLWGGFAGAVGVTAGLALHQRLIALTSTVPGLNKERASRLAYLLGGEASLTLIAAWFLTVPDRPFLVLLAFAVGFVVFVNVLLAVTPFGPRLLWRTGTIDDVRWAVRLIRERGLMRRESSS